MFSTLQPTKSNLILKFYGQSQKKFGNHCIGFYIVCETEPYRLDSFDFYIYKYPCRFSSLWLFQLVWRDFVVNHMPDRFYYKNYDGIIQKFHYIIILLIIGVHSKYNTWVVVNNCYAIMRIIYINALYCSLDVNLLRINLQNKK